MTSAEAIGFGLIWLAFWMLAAWIVYRLRAAFIFATDTYVISYWLFAVSWVGCLGFVGWGISGLFFRGLF